MNKSIFEFVQITEHKLKNKLTISHNPKQEAWWLLEKLTGKKKNQLIAQKNIELSKQHEKELAEWIRQRTVEHKPLQYILGNVPFCNLDIIVRPPILIPRPETEEWCTWLIEKINKLEPQTKNKLRILDVCCGSGCIALALAKAFPLSFVVGSDINPEAIALAQENKKHNNITNINFIQSDLFENITGPFDIIVSNPPYIPQKEWETLQPEVKEWEDPNALTAPKEGLAIYEKLIAQAPIYLERNTNLIPQRVPQIVLEIGHNQSKAISKLLKEAHFTLIETNQDLADKDRFVCANL